MALAAVRAIAYQDGKDFHGRKGALIGAGVGVLIGLLSSRSDGSEYVLTPRQGMTLFGALGAGIGGFIGLASGTPHWVMAYGDVAQRRHVATRAPVIAALRWRF